VINDLSNKPKDWKIAKIPEVLFFQEGPGVRKWQFTEEGVKLLNVGNINKGQVNLDTTKIYLSEEEAYGKYSHFLVDAGDLLIACSGIVLDNFHNKISFAEEKHLPLCLNTSTMRFKALDEKIIDIIFFKYFLQTVHFNKQLSRLITGSAQLNFGPSHINKIDLFLPSLAEQRQIAAILDAADNLRQKDQQLVEHYTTLSQSLFLEMFGDPVINPMGWEKDAVIKYCECIVPGRDKPKSFSGKTPWVTTNDLHHLAYTKQSKSYIGLTDFEIGNVKAKVIPKNSVILTCVGDLGTVSINSVPMVVNQQLHTFQCDEKNISSIFMMYALSYQTPYMNKMSSSTTVPYMNKTICNNIPMIYPPIDLQNQFSERIAIIEHQKQQAQASLEKSEALFNSLLQRAFNGELTGSKAA
jgi:type I restriction enzyme, S subunit